MLLGVIPAPVGIDHRRELAQRERPIEDVPDPLRVVHEDGEHPCRTDRAVIGRLAATLGIEATGAEQSRGLPAALADRQHLGGEVAARDVLQIDFAGGRVIPAITRLTHRASVSERVPCPI